MKDLRLIALTLTMAILLGALSPQAGALAAEQGSTMQEEIEQKDGGSNAEQSEDTANASDAGSETESGAGENGETLISAENGIPVVIIRIDESDWNGTIEEMNASADQTAECTGTLQIVVPDGFTYCDVKAAPQSLSPVRLDYIRGRGNSTWEHAKKPYKIKLDKKADLLGLGENKHWVLIANVLDKTVIKDRFTGWLGDQLGFEYTPNGVPVDVVMVAERDGEEVSRQNLGSYLLAEQVRTGKNRLDIRELTAEDTVPEDITGGYLVRFGLQTGADDPDHFFTDRGLDLANDSPTFDMSDSDYTNELQKEYIRDYIQNTEYALFGEGADDPYVNSEGIRYSEYMDMDSAAKYWLVQEASRNEDAYKTGSSYFYKKEDRPDAAGSAAGKGKICWGPLWDFDKAWGYPDLEVEGFGSAADIWISAMLYDDDENGFRRTAQRDWPQVRDTILSALEDGGLIDKYFAETKKSYDADYEIWKDIMPDDYEGRNDYRQNIDAFKQWVRNRLSWMDAHMSGTAEDGEPTLDSAVCEVTYVVDGRTARREYYKKGSICSLYAPGESEDGYMPEKEGAEFTGWIDEAGNTPDSGVRVEKDMVFTAQFEGEEPAPEEPSPETPEEPSPETPEEPSPETPEEPSPETPEEPSPEEPEEPSPEAPAGTETDPAEPAEAVVPAEPEPGPVKAEEAPGGSTELTDSEPAPHTHDLVRRKAYAPTCTEEGSIEYWACKDCGKLFADAGGKEEITKRRTVKNALGHDWGAWETSRKMTANEDGLEVRYCKRCGETEEMVIPKPDPEDSPEENHEMKPGKNSEAKHDDSQSYESSHESSYDSSNESSHESSYDPSNESSHDNNAKSDDNSDDNGNKKDEKPKDTTDTGDNSNTLLWILLILASLGGIGGLIWFRRCR